MTETAAQTLPEMLKKARESQALTLEMVSERLKLTKSQLALFESPDLELSDLTPFQRGYLRNYADILSIDISVFEKDFPQGSLVSSDLSRVEKVDASQAPVVTVKLMRWGIWILVLLILVVLFLVNQ